MYVMVVVIASEPDQLLSTKQTKMKFTCSFLRSGKVLILLSFTCASYPQGQSSTSTNQTRVSTEAVATNSVVTPTSPPTTDSGTPIRNRANEPFYRRFDQALREQFGTPAYVPPPPPIPGAAATPSTRRGLPAPFDAPPYPNGEWQIGGTEIIGDRNLTPDYPLMQAIYQGPHGQAWSDSRIKIYGWEDVSGNVSTSGRTDLNPVNAQAANFPLAYNQRPNRFEQNQFVLYAERTPDEFQTDHIDWGFRLSGVYGLDYRYMISRGYFSDQLVKHNNFYGYDSPMMYFNLYVPKVAQGLNITIGRIISAADIEAQLAPNNLMSSHSLLYAFDPYCQWGIFATLKLNDQWTVQAGLSDGNDVAIWETRDPGYQPTGMVMLQYQSPNGKFGFYGGANAFNNAEWGFNNMQQFVGTFTYKFNERVWTSHETWYMYMNHAPGQVPLPGQTNPNPDNRSLVTDAQFPVFPGKAEEWATLNYTMIRLGPSTFLTFRNEVFDDTDGQRTGYATLYSEHSIGLTYWPNRLITFRPEIRFDRAYGTHGTPYDPVNEAKPFNNGTRRNQFTAEFDVIFHF
jgi:hypothetical protein